MFDYKGLKEFLLTLKADDFRNGNKIKTCTCQNEIDRYEKNTGKKYPWTKEKVIIPNGGFHLVDVLGNDLTIVKTSKRGYRLPNGRVVNCKIIHTVIEDCRETFGTPLNGYWEIPKEFYKTKEYPIRKAFLVTPHWSDEMNDKPTYEETASKAKYKFARQLECEDNDWFKYIVKRAKEYDLFEAKPHILTKQLTDYQIGIIGHMNGNNYKNPGCRNHYVAGPDNFEHFKKLTELGIVTHPISKDIFGKDNRVFYLTKLGIEVAFSLLLRLRSQVEEAIKTNA